MNLIWIMYLNNYFIFQESKNDLIDKSHIPNHWVQFFPKNFYSSTLNTMGTRTEDHLRPNNNQESRLSSDLNEEENRYRFESQRLATFATWPASAKVSADKIAKAGFFFTGSYLEVKCAWCRCSLATWEFGDQVMSRHRRTKPDCPFVLNHSNNVPLSPSPQPLQSPLITPQTSRVDSSQSPVDATGKNEMYFWFTYLVVKVLCNGFKCLCSFLFYIGFFHRFK